VTSVLKSGLSAAKSTISFDEAAVLSFATKLMAHKASAPMLSVNLRFIFLSPEFWYVLARNFCEDLYKVVDDRQAVHDLLIPHRKKPTWLFALGERRRRVKTDPTAC
jgi:hypothetical protein